MTKAELNLWTIDELAAQVALALCVDYHGQGNGQVSHLPDQRAIRFYTSSGLLDRPVAMRGRTALYTQRHLLQLVSIKRLQTKGQSLAEIQQRLLGLSDNELAGIAQLPVSSETTAKPERRSSTFWMESPAPATNSEPGQSPSESSLQYVQLSDEVSLVIQPSRPLESDDIKAIQCVAGPLLKLLEKRRLS